MEGRGIGDWGLGIGKSGGAKPLAASQEEPIDEGSRLLQDTAAWLVPPDDDSALAGAIEALLVDDARRTALGAAARRRAEEAFDARTAASGLARHYCETAAL